MSETQKERGEGLDARLAIAKESRNSPEDKTKVSTSKGRGPFAFIANKRKLRECTPNLNSTVRAIYRVDVAARGVFSKKSAFVLDKLLRFSVSRYLLLKFYNLNFRFGQFILGGCMSFFQHVHLVIDESDPLFEDFSALHARKGRDACLEEGESSRKIHENLDKE